MHEVIDSAIEVDRADSHPLVAAAGEHARIRLRPQALHTDADGVTAEGLDELAQRGLLNHLASPAFGGAGLTRAEDRRIHEHLASGCLNTWLVWAQHAPLARRIETSLTGIAPAHELVEALLSGRIVAGAALSDVRRYPDRYIQAQRVAGGWSLNGTISWVSGWGVNSALLIAAVSPETEHVILALVPIDERFVAEPLPLAALGGQQDGARLAPQRAGRGCPGARGATDRRLACGRSRRRRGRETAAVRAGLRGH